MGHLRRFSFDELRAANSCRTEVDFGYFITDVDRNQWAVGMAGELGEFCRILTSHNRGDQPKVGDIAEMLDELADIVIYADLIAQAIGGNLGLSVINKFNKTSRKRKASTFLSRETPGVHLHDIDKYRKTIAYDSTIEPKKEQRCHDDNM